MAVKNFVIRKNWSGSGVAKLLVVVREYKLRMKIGSE